MELPLFENGFTIKEFINFNYYFEKQFFLMFI